MKTQFICTKNNMWALQCLILNSRECFSRRQTFIIVKWIKFIDWLWGQKYWKRKSQMWSWYKNTGTLCSWDYIWYCFVSYSKQHTGNMGGQFSASINIILLFTVALYSKAFYRNKHEPHKINATPLFHSQMNPLPCTMSSI